MNCLIYQPVGLGDIFWLQPIVDSLIKKGYEVWYPVEDIYRDLLKEYLPKPYLHWVDPKEDFPMKNLYGHQSNVENEKELYLAPSFADRHIPYASVMLSKYYYLGFPLVNWHNHIPLRRNIQREHDLLKRYELNDDEPFVLVNKNYGTFPNYSVREIQVDHPRVHHMSIEEDMKSGFHILDWIGAIKRASAIHTVETSLCYLIDKYNSTSQIHMYEKRRLEEPKNFYNNVSMVYRNPNWTYHVE